MIVLDTNVLSEALRPTPSAIVLRWLSAQEPRTIFTTTITQAEILYGLEALPAGKRKIRLSEAVEKIFATEFQGRILPFDEQSAHAFAKIANHRDSIGHPISQMDAMIAAICRSHSAAVATRNTADFEQCGIELVDPWSE